MATGDAPKRMFMVNLVTDESRDVQYNPEQFTETIAPMIAKLPVVGLSHQVQHYTGTDNVKFEFDLSYKATYDGPDTLRGIMDDRKFLYALTHPWRSPTIARGGLPRVLVVWPTLISLTCYVSNLAFTYTQFNQSGAPVAYKAKVTFEEVRDVFRSMEDVRDQGTLIAGEGRS